MAGVGEQGSLTRVLFDTSALFGPGNRRAITRLVDRDRPAFTPLWSEWVIAELNYGLAWQWAERCVKKGEPIGGASRREMGVSAKKMLTLMLAHFEVVTLQGAVPFPAYSWIPDEWDRHLYAAAERGGADVVVLNDEVIRDAASSAWGTIRLLGAKEFFAEFEDDDSLEPPEPDE